MLHFSLTLKPLVKGVVTSPNHPGNYPSLLEQKEKIQVEEGLVIILQFTAFNTANSHDHLRITDGDGTILVGKAYGSAMPTNITSTSNIIEMLFKTDASTSREGWSVSWSAVTPGMFDHNFHNHTSPANIVDSLDISLHSLQSRPSHTCLTQRI